MLSLSNTTLVGGISVQTCVAGLFETLNVDMIFNCPDQSEASLAADLHILVNDIEADQVSFHPLMLADSTLKPVQKRLGNVDHKREYSQLNSQLNSCVLLGQSSRTLVVGRSPQAFVTELKLLSELTQSLAKTFARLA